MGTVTSQELLMVVGDCAIIVLSTVIVVNVRFKAWLYRRHPGVRPHGRAEWAREWLPMAVVLMCVLGLMTYGSATMPGPDAGGWWVMTAVLAAVVAIMLGLGSWLYQRFGPHTRDDTTDGVDQACT